MSNKTAIKGQRYWLVGASTGIGAELAKELVKRGATVAVSARSEKELTELAGDTMTAVPLDVTDEVAVKAAAKTVAKELGGIDAVVYSAGYWKQFDATKWDAGVFARHVEVNILGFNSVIAAVLPDMIANRSGHIIGIASVAGYRGLPGSEAYGATKAFQLNMLEAMRGSLKRKNIRITTISPGFVRTPMTSTNEFPMPFLIDADEAAEAIADGLEAGRSEIVFPLPMAVVMKATKLVPVGMWGKISANMSKPPKKK